MNADKNRRDAEDAEESRKSLTLGELGVSAVHFVWFGCVLLVFHTLD